MASCEDVLGDLRISTVVVGVDPKIPTGIFQRWHRGFFAERKLVYFDIFNIDKTWDIFSKGKVVDTKITRLVLMKFFTLVWTGFP